MGRSEAQKRADKNSRHKIYENISFLFRKELRINDLVKYAANKLRMSRNMYVLTAIQSQLARDGITIDQLPPTEKYTPPVEPKQPKQYMVYIVTEMMTDPKHYAEMEATGDFLNWDDYITTTGTIAMAKDYIRNKYKKKAYPDHWFYTIYGRYFEADNKAEAIVKYRELVKEAEERYESSIPSQEDLEEMEIEYVGEDYIKYKPVETSEPFYATFHDILDEYRKPDYIERIKYSDMQAEIESEAENK